MSGIASLFPQHHGIFDSGIEQSLRDRLNLLQTKFKARTRGGMSQRDKSYAYRN